MDGAIITGDNIKLFRILTLQKGLKAELNGFRLTRGRTCYSIIKSEFGLKGNKQRVYDQFTEYVNQLKAN